MYLHLQSINNRMFHPNGSKYYLTALSTTKSGFLIQTVSRTHCNTEALRRMFILPEERKNHLSFCFKFQLSQHQDQVMGDCDSVNGPCPFSKIGCPTTEVPILICGFDILLITFGLKSQLRE